MCFELILHLPFQEGPQNYVKKGDKRKSEGKRRDDRQLGKQCKVGTAGQKRKEKVWVDHGNWVSRKIVEKAM